jgi:hypothetical protein
MSFTGIGPRFHTPGDVPNEVTGLMLPNAVYLSLGKAIDVFMAQPQ